MNTTKTKLKKFRSTIGGAAHATYQTVTKQASKLTHDNSSVTEPTKSPQTSDNSKRPDWYQATHGSE